MIRHAGGFVALLFMNYFFFFNIFNDYIAKLKKEYIIEQKVIQLFHKLFQLLKQEGHDNRIN